MACSTRVSDSAIVRRSVLIGHHPLPHCVGFAHSGFVGDVRGAVPVAVECFTLETAVHHDRHSGCAAGAALNPVPGLGVVWAAEPERALEMFVDAETFAV